MSVYRFTGPPENWITAIGLGKWAVNEHNRSIWEKLQPGDIALLHSTATKLNSKARPAIVGYAVVASHKWVKNDLLWMQEKQARKNMWPYAFTLDEVYLFNEVKGVSFQKDNLDKTPENLRLEVERFAASGIPFGALIKHARALDGNARRFPATGSASSVDPIYERLILEGNDDFFQVVGEESYEFTDRLDVLFDREVISQNQDELLASVRAYKPSSPGYILRDGERVVRKDNEAQKHKVARIENYTCQVCGFRYEYRRDNGTAGHIYEVDHILEKHDAGDESANNLWVLCPNCHAKKTRGVIKIDTSTRTVSENGRRIAITDNHLWV